MKRITIIPFLLLITMLTGCASLTLRDKARILTLGGLVGAKATVEDARHVKEILVRVDAGLDSGQVDLNAVNDEVTLAIGEIEDEKVRLALLLVKDQIVKMVVDHVNSAPWVSVTVQLKEVVGGGIEATDILILAKTPP